MKRDRSSFIENWLNSKERKPLVIRGARQTGKTWIVRNLATTHKKKLVELNFEKRPDFETLFSSNDPKEILINLNASTGSTINPLKSILFLDEIQAAPKLLAKLRWFAEEMPELPVIAAGSLLDFALSEHEFSMPVGRIGYMYLEPLSFEEFLDAVNQNELRKYLESYSIDSEIPDSIHMQLMKKIKEYLIIGGMPAAISNWVTNQDLSMVNQIHFDLLATYRDDFSKYKGRLPINRLEEVFTSVPRQLAKKFTYSNVNSEISSTALKQALELLSKARLCHRVLATSANGLPLGAETNEKYSKVIMSDCGLCAASLQLSLHQIISVTEISMINNGGMAEQLVGQLLRTILPPYFSPSLYYWNREKRNSEAEIDYIIQHEGKVVPIEVKAGVTGKLKSLHYFMMKKKKNLAVRVSSAKPKLSQVKTKDTQGSTYEYQLLSLPFYLLGQLHRLLKKTPK